MTREPDPTGFDDIVASWQREGGVPQWPTDDLWPGDGRIPPDDRIPVDNVPDGVPDGVPDNVPDAVSDGVPDGVADEVQIDIHIDDVDLPAEAAEPAADPLAEDHFVPPEPPPLPRLGPPILVGLMLIVLGLVLVTFPGWVGVPQVYGLPLGLVAIASGLGWLVLRLWPDSSDGSPPIYLDDPDDPDGGAVL